MAQTEFCAVGHGLQVVYNNHWVAVAGDANEVLVANSTGNVVSPLVAKQLKELFRARVDSTGGLRVGIVRCMQQPNARDCGLFAAAFLFEWAANSLQANLDVRFDVCVMRQHLVRCLETQDLVPFPKVRPHRNIKNKAQGTIRVTQVVRL